MKKFAAPKERLIQEWGGNFLIQEAFEILCMSARKRAKVWKEGKYHLSTWVVLLVHVKGKYALSKNLGGKVRVENNQLLGI